jgi:hypothetical protein
MRAGLTLSGLIVIFVFEIPGLERSDNPELKLANAFGEFRSDFKRAIAALFRNYSGAV